jgi:uncharacterized protein YebE (UPF0316 family)
MNINAFVSHEMMVWVVLPALIFLAGLIYVSLGTLRIIFVARGGRFLSPLLGFFEVIIWLIAINQVVGNVTNITAYFAYAAGFAVGNYVGILLEEKMALGVLVIRIIIPSCDDELRRKLAEAGFGATCVNGRGSKGEVQLIYTIVRRKDLKKVTNIIEESHANAFYSIEDARSVTKGVFPVRIRPNGGGAL